MESVLLLELLHSGSAGLLAPLPIMQGSAGIDIRCSHTRATKSKGVSDHFDTNASGRLLRTAFMPLWPH